MTAALIPVKRLEESKSRLLSYLPSEARQALTLAMLEDLIEALTATSGLDRIAVTTPDEVVARHARAAGAEVLMRPEPGLNAALEDGAHRLGLSSNEGLLIVLGDVAGASAEDFEMLIAAAAKQKGPGLWLAPSSDGGTSALLKRPAHSVPFLFGRDSAAKHRAAASEARIEFVEMALPSLSIDLDQPEDLRAFLATQGGGLRTRALLDQTLESLSSPSASSLLSKEQTEATESTQEMNAPPGPIRLIPLRGLPEIEPGMDLADEIRAAADREGALLDGRIVVVCQKIISKAEGRLVALVDVSPSKEATEIATEHERDPRQVEVVLQESKRIVRRGHGVLITETHHGFVCANAGVDLSNAPGEEVAVLLPVDPDASARRLHEALSKDGAHTPVVVTDTFGRPWREGLVDVALGCAGIAPIRDDRGSLDRAGRELIVTRPAVADQLAAAAGLLMWKAAGIPAVVVEGFPIEGDGAVKELLRDSATDLFK